MEKEERRGANPVPALKPFRHSPAVVGGEVLQFPSSWVRGCPQGKQVIRCAIGVMVCYFGQAVCRFPALLRMRICLHPRAQGKGKGRGGSTMLQWCWLVLAVQHTGGLHTVGRSTCGAVSQRLVQPAPRVGKPSGQRVGERVGDAFYPT